MRVMCEKKLSSLKPDAQKRRHPRQLLYDRDTLYHRRHGGR